MTKLYVLTVIFSVASIFGLNHLYSKELERHLADARYGKQLLYHSLGMRKCLK